MSTLWRHKFFMNLSMTSKVIHGHIDHFYAKIILAHSFMDRFWLKFVWMPISWRNIFFIKLYMTWNVTFMLLRSFEIFFTIRPFDLITIDLRSYGQLLSLFFLTITILENLHKFRTIIFKKPKYVLPHLIFMGFHAIKNLCFTICQYRPCLLYT